MTKLFLLLLSTLFLQACGEADNASSEFSKKTRPPHLVEVVTVMPATQVHTSHYTGTLTFQRSVKVKLRESGRIIELPYHEGDAVHQGDTLVQIDDDLLQRKLARARAVTQQARQELNRFLKLEKKNLVADDQLSQARTSLAIAEAEQAELQTRLGFTREVAPFSGVITERLLETGDIADSHSHVLTIADPASLSIELPVSELDIPSLTLNYPVTIRIDALGQRAFNGTIKRIFPAIDALTRRGIVEVALQPAPPGVAAGQFARVEIKHPASQVITIPVHALHHDRKGEHLYLIDEQDQVTRVDVTSGRRFADNIEIINGLQQGQRVVTRGFLGLRVKQKVRVSQSAH